MKILETLRAQIKVLLEERATAIKTMESASAKAVEENRSLTPDEDKLFTEARDRILEMDGTDDEPGELRQLEERVAELEGIVARSRAAKDVPFNVAPAGTKDDPYDIDLRSAPRTPEVMADISERSKRAIEQARDLTDEQRGRVDTLMRGRANRNGALERHIIATGRPEYRSAFAKVTTHATPLLRSEELEALEEARALNITTDASGGFLMPFTLDPTIILTNNGTINPIRERATVKQVVTDNWQGITSAGVSAGYGAESSVVGDGTPTIAQPSVKIEKAHVFIPFTHEAEDDLAALSQDASVMINDSKTRLESTKFTLGAGAGSSEPVGFVTALLAVGGSCVVASISADTYAVNDVYALQESLPARWRAGDTGSWMMNLPVINLTRKFGSALGHTFLVDLAAGNPRQLLGQELDENSEMDGVINAGAHNYLAAYGDFSGYHIHDRIGLSIELIPNLMDPTTGRPTGERGWYARWRNGGNLVVSAGLRLLNVT